MISMPCGDQDLERLKFGCTQKTVFYSSSIHKIWLDQNLGTEIVATEIMPK
jgi:hypothetical protein